MQGERGGSVRYISYSCSFINLANLTGCRTTAPLTSSYIQGRSCKGSGVQLSGPGAQLSGSGAQLSAILVCIPTYVISAPLCMYILQQYI